MSELFKNTTKILDFLGIKASSDVTTALNFLMGSPASKTFVDDIFINTSWTTLTSDLATMGANILALPTLIDIEGIIPTVADIGDWMEVNIAPLIPSLDSVYDYFIDEDTIDAFVTVTFSIIKSQIIGGSADLLIDAICDRVGSKIMDKLITYLQGVWARS